MSLQPDVTNPADDAPELAEGPAVSFEGAVFEPGRRRLLVGDARDEAAYAELMRLGRIMPVKVAFIAANTSLSLSSSTAMRPT